MLVIATDEAGYGPKLGPLCVAASVWRLPPAIGVAALEPLQRACAIDDFPPLSVADSKTLFKPGRPDGLLGLEAIVYAAVQKSVSGKRELSKAAQAPRSLREWLAQTAASDLEPLRVLPWFAGSALDAPFPQSDRLVAAADEVATRLRTEWSSAGAELLDVCQTVLDAKRFNVGCAAAGNKATLLSETTAALVVACLQRFSDSEVMIFSDRHGGRAYYGGLLQHVLPAASLQIVTESSRESHYQLNIEQRRIDWRFTVKGDAFGPVALASMVAKYTRERLMECFNRYWQTQHVRPLRPTAGYPADAARFLADIAPTIKRCGTVQDDLVRCR